MKQFITSGPAISISMTFEADIGMDITADLSGPAISISVTFEADIGMDITADLYNNVTGYLIVCDSISSNILPQTRRHYVTSLLIV